MVVGEQQPEVVRSRGVSIGLAVLGAILALMGGFLLYARQEIFNPDNLAERSKTALADERTRLAIAQPIVDGIVDSGNGELVNARPLIESVVVSALGTPPAKAAFTEAVRSIGAKLANRSPNTLLLNLTDATVVAAKALDALAPHARGVVPKEITDVKTAILGSQITITPLHWVHEVDVLGIVLPFLALILLAASIAVAPIRRLAVQRAGVAVGVAAVIGVVILIAGRSLALAQIADPLFRDAAAATWDTILGGLLAWTARGRVSRPDPRGRRPLRGRGDRSARTVDEGAGAGAQPSAAARPRGPARAGDRARRPDPDPRAPGIARGDRRRARGLADLRRRRRDPRDHRPGARGRRGPGRQASSARCGLRASPRSWSAPSSSSSWSAATSGRRPARPGRPRPATATRELCHKRLDQITFPATHNAMSAAAEPGWFLPNQRYGIIRQLDDGIRALLIDTHYGIGQSGRGFGGVITDLSRENKTREEVTKELGAETVERAEDLVGRLRFGEEPHGDAEPYLCHVLCELGATKLDDALDGIDKWMQTHPDEFLVIVVEDVVSPEETAQAFQRAGLLRYVYEPTPDTVGPTLGQLIERDKRLLVMAERDNGDGKFPWYQQAFDLMQETPVHVQERG